MDWPYLYTLPNDCPHITPLDQTSIGSVVGTIGAAASGTWLNANLAYFVPFRLSRTMVAVNMFAFNGATAGGTTSMGIYTKDGVRLVNTVSTTQVTINSVTTVAITATTLGPGLFYMAMSQSLSTSTYFRSTSLTAPLMQVVGCATMQTAHPLPTVAVFATVSTAWIPMFGLTCRAFV